MQKIRKYLALVILFCMICSMFPKDVFAQTSDSGETGRDAYDSEETDLGEMAPEKTNSEWNVSEEMDLDPSELEAEWEETGELNADGTPVTADQGDTPETSGVDQGLSEEPPQQPATYLLTLDLNGGQVNSMQNAGWSQSSYQTYQWTRSFTETVAGQGISLPLDQTLGGLLPGQPYRAGYRLIGWSVEQSEGGSDQPSITMTEDTTIVAQWQIATYTVAFQGSAGKLWSVEVPYGSTLWTDADTPWVGDHVIWTEDTATVSISLRGILYENVLVMRHQTDAEDGETPQYYYTFTLDETPYFTYAGPAPTKEGQHFVSWKLLSGGSGFTITADAVFTAQFQAEKAYVFNVYFYYANGTKAKDTIAVSKSERDILDGTLTFEVAIPEIAHYTPSVSDQEGVSWKNNTVTVDVNAVFGAEHTSATNFLALSVIYSPAEIHYTVEYYQQSVTGEYDLVGRTNAEKISYGSKILIEDRPELAGVSFEGFQISASSQSAITEGVALRDDTPNVSFTDGQATIRVYYDRASYFIYFQTGTTEVQIPPIKVQYGSEIPDLTDRFEALTREGYQAVSERDIGWYRLDASGALQSEGKIPAIMPSYDLYAVVTWRPDTTSIRLVYWVESRNASSFQNAYVTTVEGVATATELTVSLNGSVANISGVGWPAGSTGAQRIQAGFQKLMQTRYGNAKYAEFFSYSAANTKTSPGNVANAQATGTGGVTDGAITQDSYTVKVNGDGTTTVNLYYTRNLYTLEFVLARQVNNTFAVATNTNGAFSTATWTQTNAAADQFVFADFQTGVTVLKAGAGEKFGDLNVQKTYRLTEAVGRDDRSCVGRYGTKVITVFNSWYQTNYTCYVYTLTARFEADITTLWPTTENMTGQYNGYSYISMGTDGKSCYFNTHTNQHNILNSYSTMDLNVVGMGSSAADWTATPDSGNGTAAHQLVAYWNKGASTYHYYFLYEVLDTTITTSSPGVQVFYPGTADDGRYADGQYVSWDGKVYIYSKAYEIQYSTSNRSGQNQPSRQGFESKGKRYYAGTDDWKGGNIYFFYTRETYTLEIQNTDGRYAIPAALRTTSFDSLTDYGEGIRTLAQLGWESINTDGTATVRYGGALEPLGKKEVIDWLTDDTGGRLTYPYPSAGESQYYFWRWYRNLMQTVPIDWDSDNAMKTMSSNNTLYAGWFTPRYTTSYVLNGGVWQDDIHYTLNVRESVEGTVYVYYPHQADDGTDPLYWYIQSNENDRLFVDNLYVCQIQDVAEKNAQQDHWVIREDLTLEQLRAVSEEDTNGSRLVNQFYCYMGGGGGNNHEKYVNINAAVNTVLEEPKEPNRIGYTFSGWFYFDDVPESGEKVYLRDVLTGTQSIASYEVGSVYLNHVADAYLLHADENGELFYYPEQTGYRFSYTNDASVVVRDLELYAAWEPKGDAKAVVYHLVEQAAVDAGSTFTPKDGTDITVDVQKTITIGGVGYYILSTEELASLYTGSAYLQTAWEYCTDQKGIKWLPAQANIDLYADSRTQTVTEDTLASVTGNTYRIAQADGSYTYYAFFVYHATDEVVYNVYAIDLSVAVAEGVLHSFQDTFSRSFQVDTTAPYFLSVEQKSVKVADIEETTLVVENAPSVSGYSVYQDWSQVLQLQTEPDANNIFFYYVRDSAKITYTITYYRMVDGRYSSDHAVTISKIPAVTGEIISLTDMASLYDRLMTSAQEYSTYSGSSNEAQKLLYERYRNMTVTLTEYGETTTFTVDAAVPDTLDPLDIGDFYCDYYVDSWSPTGNNLVVSDGTEVEVYLADAQLIVQKVDTNQRPLAGAEFQVERLVEDVNGEISYGGKTYGVDPAFQAVTATSGEDGKAIFYNLSARVWEDGTGYLYRLTETQAPKGYNCLAEPLYVTTPYTVEGDIYYTVTYTVANTGIAYLPGAGFFGGVYTTMFLGTGLMAVGVGCGILFWRRKKFIHDVKG